MRASYFIGGEITTSTAVDFSIFLNDLLKAEAIPALVDVYLRSPGGDLGSYEVLRNMFERSPIRIHLHCVGEAYSAGFMLMYFTDNVYKSIGIYSSALLHTITTSVDVRELLNPKSYDTWTYENLKPWNKNLAKIFKDEKVLKGKQLKQFESGEDVLLGYDEFYRVMKNCPRGTFIEKGEDIEIAEDINNSVEND